MRWWQCRAAISMTRNLSVVNESSGSCTQVASREGFPCLMSLRNLVWLSFYFGSEITKTLGKRLWRSHDVPYARVSSHRGFVSGRKLSYFKHSISKMRLMAPNNLNPNCINLKIKPWNSTPKLPNKFQLIWLASHKGRVKVAPICKCLGFKLLRSDF